MDFTRLECQLRKKPLVQHDFKYFPRLAVKEISKRGKLVTHSKES